MEDTGEKLEETAVLLHNTTPSTTSTAIEVIPQVHPGVVAAKLNKDGTERKPYKGPFVAGNQFARQRGKSMNGLAKHIRKMTKDGFLIAKFLYSVIYDVDIHTGNKLRWQNKQSDKLKAAELLANRGYGLPHQSIDLEADVRGVVLTYTDMLALLENSEKGENK
jgi:hypothetical protein